MKRKGLGGGVKEDVMGMNMIKVYNKHPGEICHSETCCFVQLIISNKI